MHIKDTKPFRPTIEALPDLPSFMSYQHHNAQTSAMRYSREIALIKDIGELYGQVLKKSQLSKSLNYEDNIIFQVLSFMYFHLIFSSSCLLRCHSSEAFASARVAIDAAFIGVLIIDDRKSQAAYYARKKPFDKPVRSIKNKMEHNKLPFPEMMELLMKEYNNFSANDSHADVGSFRDRVMIKEASDGLTAHFLFFQIPDSDAGIRGQYYRLVSVFAAALFLFSGFIVEEKKIVDYAWRDNILKIGKEVAALMQESINLGDEKSKS